jgi:hypothetical protein
MRTSRSEMGNAELPEGKYVICNDMDLSKGKNILSFY